MANDYTSLYMALMGQGGGNPYGSQAGRTMDFMSQIASRPGGRGIGGGFTKEQAAEYTHMRDMLPYMVQLENANAQRGAAGLSHLANLEQQRRGFLADDYSTKQRFYKQYGI